MVNKMWALILDKSVIEVTEIDPLDRFHPSLEWVVCSGDVRPGYRYIDGTFSSGTDIDLVAAERGWRDAAVSASEWMVARHRDELDMQLATTLTAERFAELLVFRQALREWPQSEQFPEVEHRPEAPPWIAEQTQ